MYRVTLGITGLRLVHQALRWVCQASRWNGQAFWITACWYRQRKSLALGVTANVKPQREWFCVAVEYRLRSKMADLPLRN